MITYKYLSNNLISAQSSLVMTRINFTMISSHDSNKVHNDLFL